MQLALSKQQEEIVEKAAWVARDLLAWVLSARAKYLATEAALMVTSRALQTTGGRSAHKSYPLERIFRDIRTCTLMPPNTDRAMQLIGEDALGIGDESRESEDTF